MTIDQLFKTPARDLSTEDLKTRFAHSCNFAFPGTYGHGGCCVKACRIPANPRRLFGRCFNGLAVRYCLARFRATKDGQWRTAARHWILNMG
jgi:hypothetical protein